MADIQGLPQYRHQFAQAIGLGKKWNGVRDGGQLPPCETGYEHDNQSRSCVLGLAGELDPRDPIGHAHVGDHGIEMRGTADEIQRLDPVFGRLDVVTRILQRFHHHLPERRLVLDEKNRTRPAHDGSVETGRQMATSVPFPGSLWICTNPPDWVAKP